MSEKKLGTISILIKNREVLADKVQKVLSENSRLVMARMGVNVQPKCASDCIGVISAVAQGSKTELEALTKKINAIKSVSAKLNIMTK
jgi:metal-responsive CopG/Arc/MetJ family transcriptional regulator